MIDMISEAGGTAHPSYWAPFALIGGARGKSAVYQPIGGQARTSWGKPRLRAQEQHCLAEPCRLL
jgi:hypothetical protein